MLAKKLSGYAPDPEQVVIHWLSCGGGSPVKSATNRMLLLEGHKLRITSSWYFYLVLQLASSITLVRFSQSQHDKRVTFTVLCVCVCSETSSLRMQ